MLSSSATVASMGSKRAAWRSADSALVEGEGQPGQVAGLAQQGDRLVERGARFGGAAQIVERLGERQEPAAELPAIAGPAALLHELAGQRLRPVRLAAEHRERRQVAEHGSRRRARDPRFGDRPLEQGLPFDRACPAGDLRWRGRSRPARARHGRRRFRTPSPRAPSRSPPRRAAPSSRADGRARRGSAPPGRPGRGRWLRRGRG